jgi:3-hydroxyisobutyrate dehydrogenase-like beta-hydroxyacid dehydrogenase
VSVSAEANQEKVRVGLLGVGLMGSAMAHRLLDRGIAVIAWDRDSEQLRALEGRGGEPAQGPSEVVSGAGVVITMLPTAAVVSMWLSRCSRIGPRTPSGCR